MRKRRLLTLLLAVLFVVGASIPVSAEDRGTFYQSVYHYGAQVIRQGMLSGVTVYGDIAIIFNPSMDHYPSSFYHLGMRVVSKNLSGNEIANSGYLRDDPTNLHCTYTFVWSSKRIISRVEHSFYLDAPVNEPSTPTYTHTLTQ
jgi:hypothetical protein